MLIFILFTVAIEVLLFISNKNYGIATALSSQHYLWTYGPTAMLTLVAAGWNKVCYQCKVLAPWVRLSKHGQGAFSQTVLLDYVSAFEP